MIVLARQRGGAGKRKAMNLSERAPARHEGINLDGQSENCI